MIVVSRMARAALVQRMRPLTAVRVNMLPRVYPYTMRGAATSAQGRRPAISLKAGVLFAGLSAMAVSLTVYGVWDYFSAFRVWPKELREPLRAAIKAKNNGKFKRSEKNFANALEVAHTLEPAHLGADPLLKTTGIAIALAGAMESQNHWQDAAFVYLDALDEVLQRGPYAVASPKQRTPQERMRGVALAQKIADLAQHSDVVVPPCPVASNGRTIDPAEGYLTWSVEEMLRLVREAADVSVPSESAVLLSDLHLPPWVTTEDVGGSIEALGAFYAARGLAEYAVPLYIQAVGLLLPTASGDAPHTRRTPPTVAERCRAAILMNNISQVLAQGKPPSSEAPVKPALSMLDQAISWAMKGLDIATITSFRAGFLQDMPEDEREWLLRFAGFDPKRIGTVAPVLETESEGRLVQVKQQCLGTQFVLLYNVAMFHSMRGDKDTARLLLTHAHQQASRLQLREARSQCARALARLDRD